MTPNKCKMLEHLMSILKAPAVDATLPCFIAVLPFQGSKLLERKAYGIFILLLFTAQSIQEWKT